ncbi:EAL domain-containing protein [Pseudoalteromonas mariniglutinosa]|uniref:EAL domain-containing protein n=1 Tax=Pseudoalteromonas mariniglutinosa TaxID=206042 RepID=UPI00384E8D8E
MKKTLTKQLKQAGLVYMGAVLLLLVIFNIFLNDVLHDKVHSTGNNLAKQIYQLNLQPNQSQAVVSALVESHGFVMDKARVSGHFANVVGLQQEVFSYEDVQLRLFHYPTWLVESPLFIFFNLVLLGASFWGYRWWRILFKSSLSSIVSPALQHKVNKEGCVAATHAPRESTKKLNYKDMNTFYGVPTNYNHMFALFYWSKPFPDNLDIDSYFKVVIAKAFAELTNRSVKLLPSGGLAITLHAIPVTETENYTKRLHHALYQACLQYRADLSRKEVKVGVCNYRTGADQAVVYQLTKSALALAKQSPWQHIHRLPFGHTQSTVLTGDKESLSYYIQKKRFMLFFQPLFELHSGDILQHEVLLRVRHKTLGLLAARHFLPQLIGKREALLLDKTVILQVKKMQLNEPIAMPVSINLHSLNWFSRDFWHWFDSQMNDFPAASKMQFEISEDDFFQHSYKLQKSFAHIKAISATIAIDNVRCGEKLALLNSFTNISGLKLAFELIHNIDINLNQQKVVRQIVSKGNDINIPVYAVGVETQNELTTLKNLGVIAAQGFYFSEPLQKFADIAPYP